MTMGRLLRTILVSFFAGIAGAYFFTSVQPAASFESATGLDPVLVSSEFVPSSSPSPARSEFTDDFVEASRLSTNSVVYIKSISEQISSRSYLDYLFGRNPGVETRISSGSGVIFTDDGYIVTNNHVIQEADEIEVVYNRENYTAQLIGVDPSTDLAVLKIDASDLPAIRIGNSREVEVGEWVIAVGNPFNLTSTVTAGIVSAKGREINILQSNFPIESFIQTDAAINPGNSGGALVNRSGELVGINTAILSRTGSYSGYGFAVPIDIVKKIVRDLIEYGEVQKAFFGGDVVDYNADIANRLDIRGNTTYEGVLLAYLQEEGAAASAGMEEGDVIIQIDEHPIDSRAEFEEELSYHSPGDQISVVYRRNGNERMANLILTNREGTTSILRREVFYSNKLGASLEVVPKVERDLLDIDQGVKVFNIQNNGLLRQWGLTEDFIVTEINSNPVDSPRKLEEILTNIRGKVILNGVNKQGRKGYYPFFIR